MGGAGPTASCLQPVSPPQRTASENSVMLRKEGMGPAKFNLGKPCGKQSDFQSELAIFVRLDGDFPRQDCEGIVDFITTRFSGRSRLGAGDIRLRWKFFPAPAILPRLASFRKS